MRVCVYMCACMRVCVDVCATRPPQSGGLLGRPYDRGRISCECSLSPPHPVCV